MDPTPAAAVAGALVSSQATEPFSDIGAWVRVLEFRGDLCVQGGRNALARKIADENVDMW